MDESYTHTAMTSCAFELKHAYSHGGTGSSSFFQTKKRAQNIVQGGVMCGAVELDQ